MRGAKGMKIIDGKSIAQHKREEIAANTAELIKQGVTPGLAVILVGNDPASEIYVRNKEKACEKAGFYSEKYVLEEDATEAALLELINQLNADDQIDGILVQLPLPTHIDEQKVIDAISPEKDVDGFSPTNVGALLIGKEAFQPCTPKGCIALLEEAGCDLDGKKAVVIGRSNIVGKPVAIMLLARNATITVCHSHTRDLRKELADADVVIVAIGRRHFLKPDMVKDGAYIIDVGINRDASGKVSGDVDFPAFEQDQKDCYLTPVPGGVGPMTITMLLDNTLESAGRRLKKNKGQKNDEQ